MLRGTPRIEVDQRLRAARLRLERLQRLIVAMMAKRSSDVPRTGGWAPKLRRDASCKVMRADCLDP